jgi:hypothetical protein
MVMIFTYVSAVDDVQNTVRETSFLRQTSQNQLVFTEARVQSLSLGTKALHFKVEDFENGNVP